MYDRDRSHDNAMKWVVKLTWSALGFFITTIVLGLIFLALGGGENVRQVIMNVGLYGAAICCFIAVAILIRQLFKPMF